MNRTPLTNRQKQLLELMAEGKTYKEIAKALGNSKDTVRITLSSLYHRLKTVNGTQAVALALRKGWIE